MNILSTERYLLAGMTILAMAASISSCGGDGGTCAMASSCGGNIVGDWRVVSSCIKSQDHLTNSTCPAAAVSGSANITGSASYRIDGTYTVSFTLTGMDSVSIPASCISAGMTCDQVNQVFFAGQLPTLTCSASSGGCNCSLTLSPQTLTETGTYSTSGGSLTTTPAGSTADVGGYCVKGTQLDLTPPAAMAGATGTSSGDITLTRQ